MQSLQEINTIGTLKTYRVQTTRTVRELLKDLKLESKVFVVLANGKKVSLDNVIEQGSEITILPKIAGGF
ncbi:MAG: MoaD/ThiS family protein [Candidatus Lokiarchaeota archaeon]|nr:MoaD/ThiS family protein [Candidatus Harpocratesius repetitus]